MISGSPVVRTFTAWYDFRIPFIKKGQCAKEVIKPIEPVKKSVEQEKLPFERVKYPVERTNRLLERKHRRTKRSSPYY